MPLAIAPLCHSRGPLHLPWKDIFHQSIIVILIFCLRMHDTSEVANYQMSIKIGSQLYVTNKIFI